MPQINFSPASSSFSSQLINTASTTGSIVITNPGSATLTISGVSITGTNAADFSQTNNCSTLAAVSGSCTIQVTFTPTTVGSRSASISVSDNAAPSPQTVALTGTGIVPQVSFSAASLTFDNQALSTTSAAQTITLSNTGTAPLIIGGISITGATASAFSATNNCTTVLPAATCTVSVTYAPSAAGNSAATMNISDNVAGSPQTVTLVGTGIIAGSPTVFIDQPSSLSNPFEGMASFAGWAVDQYDAITGVSIAVDGVTQGSATYGASRQDVCQALTGVVGCPNIGWTFLLNTGLFSNGAHLLSVTATTSDGRSATTSGSFTVANWSSSGNAMTINIDKPATNASALNGIYQVGGWAIDNSATIAAVKISVDGVQYGTAAYGGARPDVCAVYTNRPGCPNVGWDYGLNTRLLSDGTHTLEVTGTTADGQSTTVARTISISNAGGSSTHIGIGLSGSQNVTLSGVSVVGGWAVDDYASISEVDVLVDGVQLGTATYGGLRTDVCTAYPGRPGCPQVGWSYLLDTTQLTNGAHTLGITAKTTTGGATTQTAPFSVSNTSAITHLTIDRPSAKDGAYEGIAFFTGWALDDSSAIAKVSVTVDGVSYGNATYGVNRSDVCAAYPGRSGCPNVGWTSLLDTTQLSNGSHLLGVVATTTDGRSSTASASFTVANWMPSATGNAIRLDIDAPSSQGGALSGTAHLGGWAIDDNTAIVSVQVTIDNVPYGTAIYGGTRPDVCQAYPNRPGCPNVGWDFYLDTTVLADGSHTLAITGISYSGQSATITATFSIDNLASTGMKIDIDSPAAAGSPLTGKVIIGGWAIDDSTGIASVAVDIDGNSLGDATYGVVRNDVCAVFSGRSGCPDVGWQMLLDTTQLSNGTHTLNATATTTSGQRATVTRSFSVNN